MNLTLNSHPHKSTIRHETPPKYAISNSKVKATQNNNISPPQPINQICSGFFGTCGEEGHVQYSQHYQISQQSKAAQASSKNIDRNMASRLAVRSSGRKNKISLSLKQSQIQYQTPKKQSLHISGYKKGYSSNTKVRTHGCEQNCNEQELKRIQCLNHHGKMRTEPTVQKNGVLANIHQMQESMKPSTHISSTYNNSARKTNNQASRKVKLTISNNYKPQISHEVINKLQSNIQPSKILMRKQQSGGSQQVFQETLMTARLANIYGQISNSSDANYTSSNIVYYNRIMANEQLWRYREPVPHTQIYPQLTNINYLPNQITSPITQIKFRATQLKHRQSMKQQKQASQSRQNRLKNTSILQGIEDRDDHIQKRQQNQSSYEDKINIKSKFRERKYIGEYAKTIKTFNNQSEFKSEQQSVVLQHHLFGNYFPLLGINRGSIKDYPNLTEGDIIRRQYNSFGGLQNQESSQLQKNIFRQYVSHPIQEGSLDSEKQY